MNPNSSPGGTEDTDPSTWDPVALRDLLCQAGMEGRHAARLHLDRKEAHACHLRPACEFGAGGLAGIRGNYHPGTVVIARATRSILRTAGNELDERFRTRGGRDISRNGLPGNFPGGSALAHPTVEAGTHVPPSGIHRAHPCKAENPM